MLQELARTEGLLFVDDHPAVRFGIRALIAEEPDMQLVAEHGNASADTIAVAGWADVAVLDYHLGDRDGLWLAQQIKRRAGAPPVLIYSAFADAHLAVAALVAGADGLLAKTTLAEELSVAIRRLACGRQYFPAIPPSVGRRRAVREAQAGRPGDLLDADSRCTAGRDRRAPRSRSACPRGASRIDLADDRAADGT